MSIFDRSDEIFRAMREFEKIKNNPAYQSAQEHQRRMAEDPSYRAKFDYVNRLQNDSAHKALLHFQENQHLYRQITDSSKSINQLDDRTRREVINLRNNLVHNNAELWFKAELLKPDFDWERYIRFLTRANDLMAISPVTKMDSESKESTTKQPQAAMQLIEKFYENRTIAEEDLDEDERIVTFVKLGKKEFRVKDLAVEENTNKIVAFFYDEFNDENDNAIVYCSPFRVEYRFYKEKIDSRESNEKFN